MKFIKKVLSIVIIAVIAISVYNIYNEQSIGNFLLVEGTDEGKIEYTLDKFSQSYNDGDFDSLLKCCTGRFKSDLKSQLGVGSSIFSSLISYFTSGVLNVGDSMLGYLWSMGTAYCQMDLEVIDIAYIADNEAEIKLLYTENPDSNNPKETEAYIEMKKENNYWLVASDFYQYSKV